MKKNVTAIILVFAMLTSFAACRKLENEGEWVVESKVYAVNEAGNQVDVQTSVNEEGKTEYYYFDTSGNKVSLSENEVIIETTKVYKAASTTLSPEAQSLLEEYTDIDSFEKLVEEDVTNPELGIADAPISDDLFEESSIKIGSDGRPERYHENSYKEIFESEKFTADFIVKSDSDGTTYTMPVYFTRDSDNAYISTTMPTENGVLRVEFLIRDKQCYLIVPAMRAYFKVDSDIVNELVPENLEGELEDNTVYQKSGEVTVDGVTYDCDVYTAENNTVKYYYLDGDLKRTELLTESGESFITEYSSVKKGADSSKFKIPSKYIDMSGILGDDFNLSSLG